MCRLGLCLLTLLLLLWRVGAAAPEPSSLDSAVAALLADDPVAAERLVRPLAEAGQPNAQHLLGFLYDLGLAVPMDHELGNGWQEKAAAQGHYWARLYLGWKLGLGLGLDKPDPARATALQAVLYDQVAPTRVVPSEWLGVNGLNFAPNHRRAVVWLHVQAEAGDALAAFTLAEFYYTGWVGGRRDVVEHVRWLKLAADRSYAPAMVRLKLYYGLGVLTEKDEAKSREYLLRAAEAGDADSQHELGRNYARGRDGWPKDATLAVRWYERASAKNHLAAINALADLLRKGAEGVPADLSAARKLSQRAADLGDAEAMCDLSRMLRTGEGGDKDVTQAFRLAKQAAETGYAYGQFLVGWMLTYDRDTRRDYAEARRWFDRAAAGGNSAAVREIGLQYAAARGTPEDQAEAFVWFERAARDGDSWAQNRVGWMLLNGTGIAKDVEEAMTWFRLAADQGNSTALGNLVDVLSRGAEGVPQDMPEAFRLSLGAAERGEAWAQNSAGWMLLEGLGVPTDPAAAVAWFTKAAAQAHPQALINLGRCYEQGTGTRENLNAAADCFRRAVAAGQPLGVAHLARVALKLSADERPATFREITPLIIDRAPKAEGWEIGPLVAVLLHNENPLADRALGEDLLARMRAADERRRDRLPSPPKVPIKLN